MIVTVVLTTYEMMTVTVCYTRACLAQLNFTSKAVFLENSFMSDFLDEAKLF